MSLLRAKVGDAVIFYRWGTSRPTEARVSKVGHKYLQLEGWSRLKFHRETGKSEHYSDWYVVTLEEDKGRRDRQTMRQRLREKGVEIESLRDPVLIRKVYDALRTVLDLPKIGP